MKNKFKYLTKVSLKRKFKSKWFIAVNILLAIIIVAVTNIDLIIKSIGGDFDDKTNLYVVDNTSISFDMFKNSISVGIKDYDIGEYEIISLDKTEDEVLEMLKSDDEKNSIVLFLNNSSNILDAKLISNDYIDNMTLSLINMSVNSIKTYLAVEKYNISADQLADLTSGVVIDRVILDDSKNSVEENMSMIMSTIFPIFILPFFMLCIILVQMLGSEINDEKTTRGMEIIVSNVSPKVHFFSKCVAGNIFVISQFLLLIIYIILGLFVRGIFGHFNINEISSQIGGLLNGLLTPNFISSLKYVIPLILLLMLISFVAYSLLAGILASMTTNTEDFQQIQTPIMLINLLGYYLAIMAGSFQGSIFIKVLGYIPFISAILSPSLLVMGEFTVIDMFISIGLVIVTIFLLVRYGLRIYKVGILNYSSGNLWNKMFKALKKQAN